MSELPVSAHVDDVHAHPRHTGHRWFDITMAVTAIFISTVSLYVAVLHGHTERDLVAANSWPFPQSTETDNLDGKGGVTFGVVNAGTGPAKIHCVEVFLDGRPIGSPSELLQRCCGAPTTTPAWRKVFGRHSLSTSSVDSSVLRPAESSNLLILHPDSRNAAIASAFAAALRRLTFRSCYCSVLDECWVTDMKALEATRVRVCEPPAHPYRFEPGQ